MRSSGSEGVRADLVVCAGREADAVERGVDPAEGGRVARARDDAEVLATGEVPVEAGLLDDRADPGERLFAPRGNGKTQQAHRAGRRRRQAEQHADQRRLAGSVGPEVAEGDAARHAEVDALDHGPLTELLGEGFRLDDVRGDRCRCHARHRSVPRVP
jgi:hypothetical protein